MSENHASNLHVVLYYALDALETSHFLPIIGGIAICSHSSSTDL